MSGKFPPSLTANCSLKQPRHSSKLNIPIPRIDLFMSILAYSGSVLWNSLPVSIRRPPGTEMFQITLHVIHYALTGWQCMLNLVIVTRLQGYTYNTVSPVLRAFTHQIMFATNDFKAPCLQTPMTTWVSSIWVLSVGLQTPMTTWVSSSWVLSVGLQTPRPTWVSFSWELSVVFEHPYLPGYNSSGCCLWVFKHPNLPGYRSAGCYLWAFKHPHLPGYHSSGCCLWVFKHPDLPGYRSAGCCLSAFKHPYLPGYRPSWWCRP